MEHKQKNRLRLRMTLKHLVWASALTVVLLTAGFFLFFNVTSVHPTHAMPGTIELVYFKADLRGGSVVFSWATDAEVNIDYFMVERSSDGVHFDEMLRQPAAGNSSSRVYYSDMDENPLSGYSFYRLRYASFDGQSGYSEIKTVKFKSEGNDESAITFISMGPNPFTEKFTLSFILKAATVVNFSMVNTSGQVVCKDVIYTNDGMTQHEFVDRTGLPDGIYFVVLLYNDKKIIKKIIKTDAQQTL